MYGLASVCVDLGVVLDVNHPLGIWHLVVDVLDLVEVSLELPSSASFLAELSAITEKNHKSAEIFGYYKSPRKIGSASLPTESLVSRPTCRFAKRQFFKSPGTVPVCNVSLHEVLIVLMRF